MVRKSERLKRKTPHEFYSPSAKYRKIPPIDKFPHDILVHIFGFLCPDEILRLYTHSNCVRAAAQVAIKSSKYVDFAPMLERCPSGTSLEVYEGALHCLQRKLRTIKNYGVRRPEEPPTTQLVVDLTTKFYTWDMPNLTHIHFTAIISEYTIKHLNKFPCLKTLEWDGIEVKRLKLDATTSFDECLSNINSLETMIFRKPKLSHDVQLLPPKNIKQIHVAGLHYIHRCIGVQIFESYFPFCLLNLDLPNLQIIDIPVITGYAEIHLANGRDYNFAAQALSKFPKLGYLDVTDSDSLKMQHLDHKVGEGRICHTANLEQLHFSAKYKFEGKIHLSPQLQVLTYNKFRNLGREIIFDAEYPNLTKIDLDCDIIRGSGNNMNYLFSSEKHFLYLIVTRAPNLQHIALKRLSLGSKVLPKIYSRLNFLCSLNMRECRLRLYDLICLANLVRKTDRKFDLSTEDCSFRRKHNFEEEITYRSDDYEFKRLETLLRDLNEIENLNYVQAATCVFSRRERPPMPVNHRQTIKNMLDAIDEQPVFLQTPQNE